MGVIVIVLTTAATIHLIVIVPMCVVMVAVVWMTMICDRAIRVLHATVRQMGVVMVMAVNRKAPRARSTEELHIFRALADSLRCSAATNMPVQADDRVGLGHHHMQIVRDQQNAAAR